MNQSRLSSLLPPAPHLCQECAVQHEPTEPHNWESLFFMFYCQEKGVPAGIAGAFAHCSAEVCDRWAKGMSEGGHHTLAIEIAGLSTLKKSQPGA